MSIQVKINICLIKNIMQSFSGIKPLFIIHKMQGIKQFKIIDSVKYRKNYETKVLK